jgi:ATP-dependent Clp protease protease subunit
MYINSPGGYISAMYAMYDTMCHINAPVHTIGYGTCASAASFLLAAGEPGHRVALPNAEIMIHELRSGTQGRVNDMKVDLEHSEKLYKKMAEQYRKFTGERHSLNKIKKDMERDFYMSATQALEYGLIDAVQGEKE